MTCPTCRRSTMTEITMRLRGRACTLRSCPACEARWWDADGVTTDVAAILADLAA